MIINERQVEIIDTGEIISQMRKWGSQSPDMPIWVQIWGEKKMLNSEVNLRYVVAAIIRGISQGQILFVLDEDIQKFELNIVVGDDDRVKGAIGVTNMDNFCKFLYGHEEKDADKRFDILSALYSANLMVGDKLGTPSLDEANA